MNFFHLPLHFPLSFWKKFRTLVWNRVRNFFQNLSGKWSGKWKNLKNQSGKWSGKWKKPKNPSGKWSGVEKKSIFHDNEVQKKYFSKNVQFLVMNHNTGNKIPYSRMSHPLHLHPHISLFWPKAYSEKTNWINLIRKWKKKWKNTKNQSGKWSGVATFHFKWIFHF